METKSDAERLSAAPRLFFRPCAAFLKSHPQNAPAIWYNIGHENDW
jgi:hypothetical protein